MRSFAIIGLGRFGQCMLDTLARRRLQVLVIDQNEDKIQAVRDLATKAVRADVLNAALLQEVLPEGIECAIVDLGDEMERSILVTNHLQKLGVMHIVVEAVSPAHAEILEIVGATRIVFPEQEAAERLAGMLAGHGTLDFFPVSEAFSLIEMPVPRAWIGKQLLALNLRKSKRVNVVAVRLQTVAGAEELWNLIEPEHVFQPGDIVLLAGASRQVQKLQEQ